MHEFGDGERAHGPSPSEPHNRADYPLPLSEEEVGDLHYHAEGYSSALEYYRSACEQIEAAHNEARPRSLLTMRLARKIGDCYRRQGLPVEASRQYVEALKVGAAYATDEQNASIYVRQADVLFQTSDYDRALDVLLSAMAVLASTDMHLEVGWVQRLMGACHHRLGNHAKAEEFYQDSLATYRRVGEVLRQARIYRNLAVLAKTACRWNRAMFFFDKAERLLQGEHGTPQESCILYLNRAILHRKMGQRARARADVQRGLSLARSLGDNFRLAKFRLIEGQLDIDEGRFAEAESNLLECKVLAERIHARREVALSEEFLGDLMMARGLWDEAERSYAEAETRAREISETNDILAEVYRRRAELAFERGEFTETLAMAEIGHELSDACGEEFERGYLERARGRALNALGDFKGALAALDASLAAFEKLRLPAEIAVALQLLGDLHLELNDHTNLLLARARFQQAVTLDVSNSSITPCSLYTGLARAELALGNNDEALLALFEVERLSCVSDTEADGTLDDLRAEIEAAMSSHANTLSSQYQAIADLPEMVVEDQVHLNGDLESLLRSLAKRLGVTRAILARHEVGKTKLFWRWEVGVRDARSLADHAISLLVDDEHFEGPRVWTHTAADIGWRGAKVAPQASAIVYPLIGQDGIEGVLYLDAAREGSSGFDAESLALGSTYVQLIQESLPRSTVSSSLTPDAGAVVRRRLITGSAAMEEVMVLCSKVASSPYTVLFSGETGTGKGLLASIVHEISPRAGQAFVSVNCAAIPETLLESELFGHVKGAFTGADRDREGLILSAQGGTLFLDEVGKMSLPMQSKLLHFLDSKEVRPVGGSQTVRVDARVLVASKRNLKGMVDREEFLEDLYYRLLDFPIEVPPLRDRGDDILLLARYYIDRTAEELGRSAPTMTRAYAAKLRAHRWPGNVREMEKVIKRSVILAQDDDRLRDTYLTTELSPRASRGAGSADLHNDTMPLKEQIASLERTVLRRALESHDWNRAQVARQLRISYPTLLQKIRIYELRPQ